MPAETIDTLELSIKTRANQAATKLKDLATSIDRFGENVSKYLDDMKSFGNALEKIAESATALSKIKNLGNVIRSATQKSALKKANISQAMEISKEAKRLVVPQSGKPSTRYLPAGGPWSVGKTGKVFNPATGRYETPGAPAPVPVEKVKMETNTDRSWARNISAPWTVGRDGYKFNPATGSFEREKEASETIKENMNKAASAPTDNIANAAQHARELAENARASAAEFMGTVQEADILQMKLDSVGQALGEELGSKDQDIGKVARLAEQYNKLSEKIKQVGDAANNASKESKSLKDVLKAAGASIGDSFVGKLSGQFIRIAKMRGLRYIVRELAAGLKEGTDNLYKWSSGIGGHFAGAMDTIASKAMLAKNSIATAFAPAIEALVPVLSTVVSWINSAANAFAQFIALLTGKNTWTKAVETTQQWGDATKNVGSGAKAAAKEMRDLLADWDELNIIQSESGSGGGGGGGGTGTTAADYANMFQEMDVFDKWTEHFDAIKNIVMTIGAGIAAWFAVDTIQDFLAKLGFASDKLKGVFSKIEKGIKGAVLLAIGFELAENAGRSYANNGFTWGAFAENVIGAISAGIGGAMLASTFGLNPVIGVALGLGLTVVGTIIGYNLEKTENARDFIKKRLENEVYGFDVFAQAESVEVEIRNLDQARENVRKSLTQVMQTMDIIKLGLDDGNTWSQLYDQVLGDEGLMSRIQTQLSEQKNFLTMYYTLQAGTKGAEGAAALASSQAIDMKANTWLTNKYEELGREFASYFNKGEKNEIIKGKEDMALAILQQITDAKRAAEMAVSETEFELDLIEKLQGTDAKTVLREFPKMVDEYEKQMAETQKASDRQYVLEMTNMLEQLRSLGADDDLVKEIEAHIKEAKDRIEANTYELDIDYEFKEKKKNLLEEMIKKNFGKNNTNWLDFINPVLGQILTDQSATPQEMSKFLRGNLYKYSNPFYGMDMNNTLFSEMGVGLEHILGDSIMSGMRDMLLANHSEDYAKEVFKGLGFDDKTIAELFSGNGPIAEDVKEVKEVVEEAAKTVEESVKPEADTKEDTVAALDGINESQKYLAYYFKAAQEYEKTGDKDAFLQAVDAIQIALADKPELYSSIENAVWDYAEKQGLNKDWVNRPDVPTELSNLLANATVTLDAAASGMALDSTVLNAANALTGKSDDTNNRIDKIDGRMTDLIAATDRAGNRPIVVNISPSTGFGRTMGFSNNMYGKIIG